MIRNNEIKMLLVITALISLVGIILGFNIGRAAGELITIICLLLISSFIFFTWWRYRQIGKLSSYLKKICLGDYSLDVRDNIEGELSILKSDIYKVTLMLSQQGEDLKQDKINLANAISDISHQLKTPLTSMFVMTDLLSNEKLSSDKRTEFTESIRVQLERIEWLVTSLLKLSKIDAGTIIFKKDKVKVKTLLESATAPLLIPIEIKEQLLNIKGEASTGFVGDLNWSREAIINILKNSIEHTPVGGGISINFSENPIYTEILIKDSGEGVLREDLPYIFQRFYKGKNAGEDSVGIGLAMSKAILKGQNGDVTVKSKRGEGTEFSVKFYKQIT